MFTDFKKRNTIPPLNPKKIAVNGALINLDNLNETPHILNYSRLITSLDNIIRFNGYSGFSVARHSFLLALLVNNYKSDLFEKIEQLEVYSSDAATFTLIREQLKDLIGVDTESNTIPFLGKSKKFALEALIHDFGEAFTGDIIRPFKIMNPSIREIEKTVDAQIRHHFGLTSPDLHPIIDRLDKMLGSIEAYYLTRYCGKTLIDENDEEQIIRMNSVFILDDLAIALSCTVLGCDFLTSFDLRKPLPHNFIASFLEMSKRPADRAKDYRDWTFSFENLMKMSKEDFYYHSKQMFYSCL